MAQERVSVVVPTVTVLLLILFFSIQFEISQATKFVVGGDQGWSVVVHSWPKGKKFRVGDVLEFKYNPTFYNMAEVSQEDYNKCKTSSGSKIYNTGLDRIVLKGTSYFICSVPGTCDQGMKIEVPVFV